ncbi:prepilin peptidase [Thalassoroseus pseudoceratinae]|uniref:prepilin peptidase n=1 Tax=Thalassoroseus pseudoceratinae TaxID=2713176 RepID=UPI00142284ED|nr:A24 family peptidase [Thalassoroseus pseudoceratinae]
MTDFTLPIAIATASGIPAGSAALWWGRRLTPEESESRSSSLVMTILVPLITAGFFAGLTWATLAARCQEIESVSLSQTGEYVRLGFHLVLITLLMTAVVTDLRDYVIPDAITIPGMIIGVAASTVSGALELVPLWIDWNMAILGYRGAYVPEWITLHPHWHGLAWSLTGLLAGGMIVAVTRWIARVILGREALGFGDVTLMAMIGSFIGWQAVLFTFAIAPLAGLAVAVVLGIVSGRSFVGFGPYLAAAAIAVLFSWRWMWTPLRNTFGDWISLAILTSVAMGAFCVLLAVVRAFRAMPFEQTKRR